MKTSDKPLYLEHANITVRNIENSIRFFQTAFPDFEVRGGNLESEDRWLHLGTADTYVALNEKMRTPKGKAYHGTGINHIGFVVSDVQDLADRLEHAGYQRSYPTQIEKFRIRDYFLDDDGNEYEFVQYLSEETAERNAYEV